MQAKNEIKLTKRLYLKTNMVYNILELLYCLLKIQIHQRRWIYVG